MTAPAPKQLLVYTGSDQAGFLLLTLNDLATNLQKALRKKMTNKIPAVPATAGAKRVPSTITLDAGQPECIRTLDQQLDIFIEHFNYIVNTAVGRGINGGKTQQELDQEDSDKRSLNQKYFYILNIFDTMITQLEDGYTTWKKTDQKKAFVSDTANIENKYRYLLQEINNYVLQNAYKAPTTSPTPEETKREAADVAAQKVLTDKLDAEVAVLHALIAETDSHKQINSILTFLNRCKLTFKTDIERMGMFPDPIVYFDSRNNLTYNKVTMTDNDLAQTKNYIGTLAKQTDPTQPRLYKPSYVGLGSQDSFQQTILEQRGEDVELEQPILNLLNKLVGDF